jgi:hypothetical protein
MNELHQNQPDGTRLGARLIPSLVALWCGIILLSGCASAKPKAHPHDDTTSITGRLVPPAKRLTTQEIGDLVRRFHTMDQLDRASLHSLLDADRYYLRASAAQQLGETGDATSIPHLIDALNDEVLHADTQPPNGRKDRTPFWANQSLKRLTKQDFGFNWNEPKLQRDAAIKRWREWFKSTQ